MDELAKKRKEYLKEVETFIKNNLNHELTVLNRLQKRSV